MPQAVNILLADAQATPVTHTFVPVGRDANGVFWYDDQSATNVIGYWRISVDVKRPGNAAAGESSNNRTFRVKVGLHEPALETVSNNTASGIAPAPTVAYTCRCITEFILPERSTSQNRKDLRKMIGTLLNGNVVLQSVIEDLQYLY